MRLRPHLLQLPCTLPQPSSPQHGKAWRVPRVQVMAAEGGAVDVVVVAPLDARRRGRPRVVQDVAVVLAATPLTVEAAFVGPLEHCAGQDRVPADVLNDLMSSLHLPGLQVCPPPACAPISRDHSHASLPHSHPWHLLSAVALERGCTS